MILKVIPELRTATMTIETKGFIKDEHYYDSHEEYYRILNEHLGKYYSPFSLPIDEKQDQSLLNGKLVVITKEEGGEPMVFHGCSFFVMNNDGLTVDRFN
jgi:hypothetical protein